MRAFLLISAAFFAIVSLAWFVFEYRWDRKLFAVPDGSGEIFINLSCRDLEQLLSEDPGLAIIDVRSRGQYEQCHLPEAISLPSGSDEFNDRLATMDRDRPYLVYCDGGFRSRLAYGAMKKEGFTRLYNLHRGLLAWRLQGKPVVK